MRQRNRRTVCTFQQRSLVDRMIQVFNGPSLDLSCERRKASTVPTQALGLFKSQLTNDSALAMAVRLERESTIVEGRIRRGFELPLAGRWRTPNCNPRGGITRGRWLFTKRTRHRRKWRFSRLCIKSRAR